MHSHGKKCTDRQMRNTISRNRHSRHSDQCTSSLASRHDQNLTSSVACLKCPRQHIYPAISVVRCEQLARAQRHSPGPCIYLPLAAHIYRLTQEVLAWWRHCGASSRPGRKSSSRQTRSSRRPEISPYTQR